MKTQDMSLNLCLTENEYNKFITKSNLLNINTTMLIRTACIMALNENFTSEKTLFEKRLQAKISNELHEKVKQKSVLLNISIKDMILKIIDKI